MEKDELAKLHFNETVFLKTLLENVKKERANGQSATLFDLLNEFKSVKKAPKKTKIARVLKTK